MIIPLTALQSAQTNFVASRIQRPIHRDTSVAVVGNRMIEMLDFARLERWLFFPGPMMEHLLQGGQV